MVRHDKDIYSQVFPEILKYFPRGIKEENLDSLSVIAGKRIGAKQAEQMGYVCIKRANYNAGYGENAGVWVNQKIYEIILKYRPHIQATRAEKRARKKASKQKLKGILQTLFPDAGPYQAARQLDRAHVLHVGPTNSGKTHEAFEHLRHNGKTAIYLAPLRLMALEWCDTLRSWGLHVSLITGEERDVDPGARVVCSTIEMLDPVTAVDLCIIDEVQMIADKQRGWAWVNAIVGAPASKIIMTGSADSLQAVKSITGYLREPLEIKTFERKTVIEVLEQPTPLDQIEPQTAIVCFSRRTVLDLRHELNKKYPTAVIYGALGPEVRREEARRFREGEAQVLVATDAIGLGMNLPIRTLIFYAVEKYYRGETARIPDSQIQQIAGRAGRYGYFETGRVGAISSKILTTVKRGMQRPQLPIKPPFAIMPTWHHITSIAQALGTRSLVKILSFYRDKIDIAESLFSKANVSELISLAERADWYNAITLEDKFVFAKSPVDPNNRRLISAFDEWLGAFFKNEKIDVPILRDTYRDPTAVANSQDELREAEDNAKIRNLYNWLSYNFPDRFTQQEQSFDQLGILNRFIKHSLKNGKFERRCVTCGKSLAITQPFPKCDACYQNRYNYRDDRW